MVSILRTVLATTGPMEGVESSGLLGGPQLGSEVTLVWQCLQIQAVRGGGSWKFPAQARSHRGFWQLDIQTQVVG